MDSFFYRNEFSAGALIKHHYWKFEFTFEATNIYSTFVRSIHVMLTLNDYDNTVGIYSSINKYKPQIYKNLVVVRDHTLGNDVFAFDAKILESEEYSLESDTEDDVYECFDVQNTLCKPQHTIFYNNPIIRPYDWSTLKLDVDYKLLQMPSNFTESLYITQVDHFMRILLGKELTSSDCHHCGRRMKYTTGGYKQLLFHIVTDEHFVCPCSLLSFINDVHSSVKYNYILLSYKLSQLFMSF